MSNFRYKLQILGSVRQLIEVRDLLLSIGYTGVPIISIGQSILTHQDGSMKSAASSEGWDYIVVADELQIIKALASIRTGGPIQVGEPLVARFNMISEDEKTVIDPRRIYWAYEDEITKRLLNIDGSSNIFKRPTAQEVMEILSVKPESKPKAEIVAYEIIKLWPGASASTKVGSKFVASYNNSEIWRNSSINVLYRKDLERYPEFFKPIYEEESETIEVKMRSMQGAFLLHVSKKGIFYQTENAWINVDAIRRMINQLDNPKRLRNIPYKTGSGVENNYKFRSVIEYIDSGCKKRVPIEDWREVLKAYDKLQKA